jgi:hypothetical protein
MRIALLTPSRRLTEPALHLRPRAPARLGPRDDSCVAAAEFAESLEGRSSPWT